ncbi:MAG: oligosaccharide flippase family protein [Mariniphaga sp.]
MTIHNLLNYLREKFKLIPDDRRTSLVKKNIYFSILIKGFSISISFLLVPLTLNYLSAYEFGVWITLSSILTWINYFDIGLGNGLRNRLAESMAVDDERLGQIYISTTFVILSIIITGIFLLFIALHPYLNWDKILNVDPTKVANLNSVITISFALFCTSFLFKLIGIVYSAAQKPAINDLITLLGSLLSLIIIFVLTKTTEASLMKVALTFSVAPVIVLLVAYPITFYRYFKNYRPKLSAVNHRYTKDLMNLGVQFFILQISGLIIFGTSNVIISRIFGPEQVTPYSIAFKYFGVVTMIFSIIISPMWSASTDAFAKGDLHWIKRSMNSMMKLSVLSSVGVLVLILSANLVYRLWVGPDVIIPFSLTIWMGLYTIVVLWSSCFSTFLFGIGKLRVQLINTVIASVLFIPMAIWLSKSLGVKGIVISLCIINLSGAVLNPIQYFKIISGKPSGIWNK